eukprot:5378119-Lingulodinium_polyedra.AAC.1
MHRLLKKGGTLAQDWTQLYAAGKNVFFAANQDTQSDELIDAAISFSNDHINTIYAASERTYLPLSVYESQGYNAEHLKNIKHNAKRRFDPTLNCDVYQLM